MAIIRRFRVDDLRRVMDICEVSFKEKYIAEFLLSCFDISPEHFLVAEKRGVVGIILGIKCFNSLGRILILAVDPNFRGRGIGEALAEVLLKSYVASGIEEVRLEARITNYIALNLYEKLGFRIVGRTKNYYEDGEDAFILFKSLLPVSALD